MAVRAMVDARTVIAAALLLTAGFAAPPSLAGTGASDAEPEPTCPDLEFQDNEYPRYVHVHVQEGCSVDVTLFEDIICAGPWGGAAETQAGPANITAYYCSPWHGPGPIETNTEDTGPLGPFTPGNSDACEGWAGDADLGGLEDRCIVHIENQPPNCVGPWTQTIQGTAGPVAYTVHTCDPLMGQDPVSTQTSAPNPREPLKDSSCDGWDKGTVPDGAPVDDGCVYTLETQCVGGWSLGVIEGNAGPIGFHLTICDPFMGQDPW